MSKNEVARLQPSRLPIPPAIAREFEIEPAEWRVLVEQIFPSAKTVEAVTMALSYCRARHLDIYKKPVHIVPMWSSAAGRMVETVWPGISEIRTTAARTGEYAGIEAVEYGPTRTEQFSGQVKDGGAWKNVTKEVSFPEWASVVVYRVTKGVRCPYHAKVFWRETYATAGKGSVPNDMWAKRPYGQLDKCVEAAALRKAFPEEIGNEYTAEEMEGRAIDAAIVPSEEIPTPPEPPKIDASSDETFDPGVFLVELEEAIEAAENAEQVEAVFEEMEPQTKLENEDDLQTAFDLKNARIKSLESDDFPGDKPAEKNDAHEADDA